MPDEQSHEHDASLEAAPQGTSEAGRAHLQDDPDTGDTQEGGEHHPSAADPGDEPLERGEASDPDAEQADPESGAAADATGREDAGHA